MDDFASLALAAYGGLAFLAFVVFGLISVREREPRAARISLALAVGIVLNCGLFFHSSRRRCRSSSFLPFPVD